MGDGVKKDRLVVVPHLDQWDVMFTLGPDAVRVARCDTPEAAANWIAVTNLGAKTLAQSIKHIGAARDLLIDLCNKHPEKLDAADGPVPPKGPP